MCESHRNIYLQLGCCLAFLLFVVFPYNSFAATACVESGTRAVVLEATKVETDYHPNVGTSICTIDFNDGSKGRIIAAAVTDNYVLSDDDTTLIDNGVVIHGGEKNGDNCFCKFVYPVASAWVKHPVKLGSGGYGWLDARGYGCDGYCGYSIRYTSPVEFKQALYNSITN